ncbi:MAG: DNA polymerase III subunit gamma/tau [Coriobacteriia bacterium]|nr:DNA polymerase III subunit gamma/tau [Coriobacteriia bacterium]MBN2822875.1 DNA polymerase III subunit gamma/tau [Coriobacteriia bacterium]
MAHQSWYRTYRPQRFDEVVGQEHIERTLRNAVADDSVSHAYLFTGPRGTGKTTTARILAKALDCEQGPTGEPDDTCEDCRLIAEGRHPDVYELDAASRTGVDAVREEIISRVNYAPTRRTWKVYIIDEVHMLSTSAFNALLKTLEEPPSHTVFILCTTHPHKVPETIHSRCQRFDFHRLSVEDIVARLRHIADAEGVQVVDGALTLIAKHALGGMRDAITTLEQLASFTSGNIALSDVEGLLGEVDDDLLFEVADLVARRDVAGAFRFVARLAEAGVDMTEFVKSLVQHFRDLFVVSVVEEADGAVDVTTEALTRLEGQAASLGADRIARVLDVLARLSAELRWTGDQRLSVEVALVRMARPESDLTIEALAERIATLEAAGPLPFSAPVPVVASSAAPIPATARKADPDVNKQEPTVAPELQKPAAEPAPPTAPVHQPAPVAATGASLDAVVVKRSWPAIQAEFKKLRPSRSHLFDGSEVEVEDDVLVVEFPASQDFSLQIARTPETVQLLKQSIVAVLRIDPPLELRLGRSGGSRPNVKPSVPSPDDTAPPLVDETESRPAHVPDQADSDITKLVMDELGAEMIVDHEPES